jgi:hypothetical protein
MMIRSLHLSAATLALAAYASGAGAQDNYEIQVYGSETMAPHVTMFELHSNFTPIGRRLTEDGVLPTNHQLHETLEITRGLNTWSELGFYVFTSAAPDQGYSYVGSHIRPRVRVPESWDWPVGLSLSTEFGWQSSEFSADTWSLEIRPIIDKQMGPWYLSVNPVLGKSLRGANAGSGFDFEPNVAFTRDVSHLVNLGVEYYGAWGAVRSLAPPSEREHQLFGVVNLDIAPEWEFNAGVGFGFTATQEKRILKLILGRRVGPLPAP